MMLRPFEMRAFLVMVFILIWAPIGIAGERDEFRHAFAALAPRADLVDVPVVGCAIDGQISEPVRQTPAYAHVAPASVAPELAFYEAGFGGVLAPRGWHCIGSEGSGGSALFVTPEQLDRSPIDKKVEGPVVAFFVAFTDTSFSGRDSVARVAARLFPAHKAFVVHTVKVQRENTGSIIPNAYPFGPPPDDRITRRSPSLVEFTTPPNKEGMGTSGGIAKGDEPIAGAAFLAQDNTCVQTISVRLPDKQKALAPSVIGFAGLLH
jgi:hypothetical protein